MRSLWKGAISFGLVHIPVRLYTATSSKSVKFNYLHSECKSPVKYMKYCPKCDKEVEMSEIVKGYEYEKGAFVVLKDEDFDNLPTPSTKVVKIVDFVTMEEIDPIYYSKTYYLEPIEGGAKAYALLRRAMEDTGRAAVAQVTIRSKESLACIRVYEGRVLAMETMFYPDEIRGWEGLQGVGAETEEEIHENELTMAKSLIGNLAADFDPGKYHDRYREALKAMIQERITGEEVYRPEEPTTARVVDLMEALKTSIELTKQKDKTEDRAVH